MYLIILLLSTVFALFVGFLTIILIILRRIEFLREFLAKVEKKVISNGIQEI